jgi:hypothetical protein
LLLKAVRRQAIGSSGGMTVVAMAQTKAASSRAMARRAAGFDHGHGVSHRLSLHPCPGLQGRPQDAAFKLS